MSKQWGKAKTAIAVLSKEIERRIKSGETAAAVYDALVAEGQAEGFSRSSFFRWVQPKAKTGRSPSNLTTGTTKRQTAASPPRALPSPYQSTIQPATPLTGTPNGSPLMLGDDDDGTN